MTPADERARIRIREDLDATLVVEAAAGTGKTTCLVARIVALVRSGRAALPSIVALTFTEKAAGEMKLRLRAEIERAREGADAVQDARLLSALAELETARVGTIHSFCADLLREHPVEARVDPLFEMAADDEAERIFDPAFDAWFQSVLGAPPEGVRRLLRRRPRRFDDEGPRERLRRAGRDLALERRDFDAPWRREPFDRDGEMERALAGLTEVSALKSFLEDRARLDAVRGQDPDGLEGELVNLLRDDRRWKGGAKTAAAKEALAAFVRRADADLAACLREELRPLVEAYERRKAVAGKLDFLDLLVRARDLVRDHAGVRAELQGRFTHLLVDEFQDTDPLQAEILLLLAADDPGERDFSRVRPRAGKLFVVGDPKQSIYRFRRADVALYEACKRRLLDRGAELVHLTTSFRGAASIQEAVNAAFAPAMAGGGQAEYVPLARFRDDPEGRPAVVALPVPRPYGDYGRVTNKAIEASFPDAVAAFVEWLVSESGWTVSERDRPGTVKIEPRHVCLLFKRFQAYGADATGGYARALDARGIPHVLLGGRTYHEREEVMALRAALRAIEWPDDELSLYATLRGPFFALQDDALLAFKQAYATLHPLRPLDAAALAEWARPVAEALAILARLHYGRNRRPLADTVTRLLDATRAHAGLLCWTAGEQALANVLRVVDLARRFEAAGATSFRAFVDDLDAAAERGESPEALVVEEGTEGVRIMTVHRAKGLEFPVVILCDPTAPAAGRNPSRYVDADRRLCATPLAGCAPVELSLHRDEALRHDEEEAVRIAYVAATRARDLLVVPAVGDEERSGWLAVLNPVLYPREGTQRAPAKAKGCPAFSDDSVLERQSRRPADTVAPGLHIPRAGAHRVAWWDPRALRLDVEAHGGLQQWRILSADAGGSADAGERAHAEWQARRSAAVDRGSTESVRVETATGLSAGKTGDTERTVLGEPAAGLAVLSVSPVFPKREGRPRGRRFGTLVHAVLASVDLDAGRDAVARAAALQGRLHGAPEHEVAAAVDAALAALAHPLLRRAAGSPDSRREAPLLLRLEGGALLEGVADLVFREPDGAWTVVDFKTDAEIEVHRARYEAQVRAYARAVAAATASRAAAVLLEV